MRIGKLMRSLGAHESSLQESRKPWLDPAQPSVKAREARSRSNVKASDGLPQYVRCVIDTNGIKATSRKAQSPNLELSAAHRLEANGPKGGGKSR